VTETAQLSPRPARPTWVMGHKNPDTDAICSALA
jgi:c-di-AMP phosphodiesterase-like protein